MATDKELLYSDAAYTDTTAPTEKQALYSDAGYTFSPQETSAYQAVLDKWRTAVNSFDLALADLQRRGSQPMPPDLAAEYQGLVARAQSMGPKITAVRAAVDDVLAAMSGAWSSVTGAWQSAADWIGLSGPPEDEGLGVLQFLIPAAAIAVAIALISAFLVDYAKFTKRADMYASLVAGGKTPEQASGIVANVLPDTSLFSASIGGVPLWVLVLGAGAAYWYFNKRGAR